MRNHVKRKQSRAGFMLGMAVAMASVLGPHELRAAERKLGGRSGAEAPDALTLYCNLGVKPAQTLHRFWSVESHSAQQAEFWAVRQPRQDESASPVSRDLRSMSLDMMLGGLPTTTAPYRKESGQVLRRDAGHIFANPERAFCDLATQRRDAQGNPKFVTVKASGARIPDCTDYYLGKDKTGIGGAGVGGDPQVDNLGHPFLQYYECYQWDGQQYRYDWTALERRLDAALAVCPISYFIPGIPWEFQRGMTFCRTDDPRAIRAIPNGWFQYTGTIYPATMRETRYGNELVPDRLDDYGRFLEAAVRHLATSPKYKDQVADWQWKIGQEVDTRAYTMERYFKLYRVSEQAIRRVLPQARIGVHIGVAHEKGWIPPFLRYCRQNALRCDFVGISCYRRLNRPNSEPDAVDKWLKPFLKLPAWPANTRLEIHEFGIEPPPNAPDPKAQQMSYYAFFADQLLQLPGFGEWFKGAYVSTPCLAWLESVAGQDLLRCQARGTSAAPDGRIGAILTRAPARGSLSALVYNYNLAATQATVEKVQLNLTGLPPSKTYHLELKSFRADQLVDQQTLPAQRVTGQGGLQVGFPLAANSIVTLMMQP